MPTIYNSRKEADPRYTWDFTHIYPSEAAWEEELTALRSEVEAFAAVKGTLGASAESLKSGLDRYYAIARRLEIAYVYAMIHSSTDNGDPANQRMIGLASQLFARANQVSSFINPEILAIDETTLAGYMADPALSG